MACRLLRAKLLPESLLIYFQLFWIEIIKILIKILRELEAILNVFMLIVHCANKQIITIMLQQD